MKMIKKQMVLLMLLALASCSSGPKENDTNVTVSESSIGKHMERLASDEFMGRMPFSLGEEKTVNYLETEFKKLGTLPGNGDSYFQDVPLTEIDGIPSDKMQFSGPDRQFALDYFTDFVAATDIPAERIGLENSDLVFAGYGIVAPEYGWNDYEGIDWNGKTAVVLVNDPGFRSGDSTLFKGDEMTYYGRWTYKYEEAGRQGAAGVIIIHQTDPAGYGWNVVSSSWSGPHMISENDNPKARVQGWITSGSAEKLFQGSGLEGVDLRAVARNREFHPVPLEMTVSVEIENKISHNVSKNVLAVIPGTDRKDEYIIYSAHWDHLGVGRPVNGDSIYNGAIDNASGTACLLALAEAFKKSDPTRRSILFLAVTAEEQGLLGSGYYADHPVYDPEKTVADINMDGFLAPEPMKDLTITGFGHSEMDEYAQRSAKEHGRYIIPDPQPEKGFFFRSDHFNFARIGIPALYAAGAYEGVEHGSEYIEELRSDYEQHKYHQPSDEFDPSMPLEGIQADAQLLFEIGLLLANEDYFPKWYERSEFYTARD